MDFARESSPPPAYSEGDYDRKLVADFELSLAIEEEEDEESRPEHSINSRPQDATHPRAIRRLPVPPSPGEAMKPLRIHKKSASHSYGSYPSPRAERSNHAIPSSPAFTTGLSTPKKLSSARSSHTRAASHLHDFDASIAYNHPEYAPVSPESTRTFNPNSLYNSAVSSHLHTSSPSPWVPPRLHTPHSRPVSSATHLTLSSEARAPPSPQHAQSPSSLYPATRYPLHPAYRSPTDHDRQFLPT